MANLRREFGLFHARIALTIGNRSVLRMARKAMRERIRRYFRDVLQLPVPKFRGQGGYAMNTLINPLNGEYDIDDGVYLQHLDNRCKDFWPAAGMVHRWLTNALEGVGAGRAESKRACVRTRYQGLFRVDLPVYGQLNGRLMLADRAECSWRYNDPLALSKWFGRYASRRGDQLRRIVRYLKAWADHQSHSCCEMPGGVILTVLAVRHFRAHERDEISLAYTLNTISNAVSPVFYLPNPVDITEELTSRLNLDQKRQFQKAVKAASKEALKALNINDAEIACRIWRRLLGDRFPEA